MRAVPAPRLEGLLPSLASKSPRKCRSGHVLRNRSRARGGAPGRREDNVRGGARVRVRGLARPRGASRAGAGPGPRRLRCCVPHFACSVACAWSSRWAPRRRWPGRPSGKQRPDSIRTWEDRWKSHPPPFPTCPVRRGRRIRPPRAASCQAPPGDELPARSTAAPWTAPSPRRPRNPPARPTRWPSSCSTRRREPQRRGRGLRHLPGVDASSGGIVACHGQPGPLLVATS